MIAIDPDASAASDNLCDDVIESCANLGGHRTEPSVTDAFLETRQHRFLVASIDVDDAIRGETDRGQGAARTDPAG
jgi:hypothetical protein